MNQFVQLERKQGLAVITLANPDFNRINRSVVSSLKDALPQLQAPDVRAVLLKADGAAFSYGANVKDMFLDITSAEFVSVLQSYMEVITAIEHLSVPTIAAVHGVCSSGGLELALAFDHLWAAAGTKIGFMEASIGLFPLAGGVQRVATRAGVARAYEIATAGRHYDAEAFERWGIVTRVVDSAKLVDEAEAFALKLASGPTSAFAAVKYLLREMDERGLAGADLILANEVLQVLTTQDAKNAASALMAGPANLATVKFTGQ